MLELLRVIGAELRLALLHQPLLHQPCQRFFEAYLAVFQLTDNAFQFGQGLFERGMIGRRRWAHGRILASRELPCSEEAGELAGAYEDIAIFPVSVQLGDGDMLVLYTDGVTDAVGTNGRFGKQRLEQVLSGLRTPADVVDRIENAITGFQRGDQRDDRAVLAIMRTR